MFYERLNPEMRSTVDEYAVRLQTLSWQGRTSLLAEASSSFEERFEGRAAKLATRAFVTAVLERLNDAAEVDNPHQAFLLSLSLLPEHRDRVEAYLQETDTVH